MKSILVHSTYFPTIVQMAAIVQASHVVFETEDNYQKQTYRNRCYIAHNNGKLLLNIPIKHTKSGKRQKTKDVITENSFPWQSQHWKSLQNAYRTSPFFEYYEDELKPIFYSPVTSLLKFNNKTFELLCELLDISINTSETKKYEEESSINDLRFLVDAKSKKEYSLQAYTQVLESNHGFLPNLSVLDLLFNEGPNAVQYLESQKLTFI